MIELPDQHPCEICEGRVSPDADKTLIDECRHTMTVINPYQFETGQCCVITRRHVALLLDLSDDELAAVLRAAKRAAQALLSAFKPLGILTFQNNGVYSGQEVPHFHFHVIPRQPGSDWGVGPPQLTVFEDAGRVRGTPHDPTGDDERRARALVDPSILYETTDRIRAHLPA